MRRLKRSSRQPSGEQGAVRRAGRHGNPLHIPYLVSFFEPLEYGSAGLDRVGGWALGLGLSVRGLEGTRAVVALGER